MVNDFIIYDKRVEGNEICKCFHFERDHNYDGIKCSVCQCVAFDLSDMNGSTIEEIFDAWNETNENQ